MRRMSLSSKTREAITYKRHWLDYDPVALAVLAIGIALIELLAIII